MTFSNHGADLVIINANIVTLDVMSPSASALAVRNGRLIAVGGYRDAYPHIGRKTVVIDAAGSTLTPGLTDSHQHPVWGISTSRGIDLSGAVSFPEARRRLTDYAAEHGADEWVIGHGGEYSAFPSAICYRELLDSIVGKQPVFIWMSDLHGALLNSKALRWLGISEPQSFADHSEIVCDQDGPTGELRELTACLTAYDRVPTIGASEIERRVESLFSEQNRCGITCIHVLDDAPLTASTLIGLAKKSRLSVRVKFAPWLLPGSTGDLVDRINDLRKDMAPYGAKDPFLHLSAVKFFLDGAIDGGGAWLSEPDTCGQSTDAFWKDIDQYHEAVHITTALGLPSWTHAIGDRAVGVALDTYRKAGPPFSGCHRVEHVELLADSDVARFAELDVVASVQPTHMDWTLPNHSDNWSTRVGPVRFKRAWRYGDIVRSGGSIVLGSDWPIANYDPRVVMAGAQMRRPVGEPDRSPIGPEQALSAIRALNAYTTAPVRTTGEAHIAGRIRVGARADFTAFAENPLKCSATQLPQLPIVLTVVGGRITFREI